MDPVQMWFQGADADRDGLLNGAEAAALLSRFGLDKPSLKKIWDLSDELGRGFLSAEEFRRATQLVSLAQMGHPVTDDLARRLRAGALPPPPPPQMRVQGPSPPTAPTAPPTASVAWPPPQQQLARPQPPPAAPAPIPMHSAGSPLPADLFGPGAPAAPAAAPMEARPAYGAPAAPGGGAARAVDPFAPLPPRAQQPQQPPPGQAYGQFPPQLAQYQPTQPPYQPLSPYQQYQAPSAPSLAAAAAAPHAEQALAGASREDAERFRALQASADAAEKELHDKRAAAAAAATAARELTARTRDLSLFKSRCEAELSEAEYQAARAEGELAEAKRRHEAVAKAAELAQGRLGAQQERAQAANAERAALAAAVQRLKEDSDAIESGRMGFGGGDGGQADVALQQALPQLLAQAQSICAQLVGKAQAAGVPVPLGLLSAPAGGAAAGPYPEWAAGAAEWQDFDDFIDARFTLVGGHQLSAPSATLA